MSDLGLAYGRLIFLFLQNVNEGIRNNCKNPNSNSMIRILNVLEFVKTRVINMSTRH